VFLILFRRQIDHDEPVDADRLGIGKETRDAMNVDRIVIAHQDDRGITILFAKGAHELECLRQRLAGLERAQSRSLDGGTIRHRIRERHAELDDVGARLGQGLEDGQRGCTIGVTRGHEGDERRAVLRAAPIEPSGEAGRHDACFSSISATCGTSLSPRPERLTTMR
jgi:hypothetical protein